MSVDRYIKLVFGLLLIAVGLYSYTLTLFGGYPWWIELVHLIKGGFGAVVILLGLLVMAIAASD